MDPSASSTSAGCRPELTHKWHGTSLRPREARGARVLGPGCGAARPWALGRSDHAGDMTRFGVPPGSIVVGVDGSEDAARAVAGRPVRPCWRGGCSRSSTAPTRRRCGTPPGWTPGHRPPRTDGRAARGRPGGHRHGLRAGRRRRPRSRGGHRARRRRPADGRSSTCRPRRTWSCSAPAVAARCARRCSARSAPRWPGTRTAPSWSAGHPASGPSAEPRIVVGADGSPASQPVLEFAFVQASLHAGPPRRSCTASGTDRRDRGPRSSHRASPTTSPTCGCCSPSRSPGSRRSSPTSRSPRSWPADWSTSASSTGPGRQAPRRRPQPRLGVVAVPARLVRARRAGARAHHGGRGARVRLMKEKRR